MVSTKQGAGAQETTCETALARSSPPSPPSPSSRQSFGADVTSSAEPLPLDPVQVQMRGAVKGMQRACCVWFLLGAIPCQRVGQRRAGWDLAAVAMARSASAETPVVSQFARPVYPVWTVNEMEPALDH